MPESRYQKIKVYKKAILPKGFKANALACGLKKSGKLDLALIYSVAPAKASALFTSNTIQAAPVIIDKQLLKKGSSIQAILANSGNANCYNGRLGLKDAEATAYALALSLGVNREKILLASTGIIGRRLPVAKIKKGIPQLASGLTERGINKVKLAILTTDTFPKEITLKFSLGAKTVTICGIAKGAGMIAPDMATMLAFIMTDAAVSKGALDKALRVCAESSFNCITVDGCMSTNDTLIMLANGEAGNKLISQGPQFNLFVSALRLACVELAKMIVLDAEGASKFIRIEVNKAASFREARRAALAVANSNLFKTAMYGENPNFGRIAAAIGASGLKIREEDLKISVSQLKKKEISVIVSLNRGRQGAVVYTSDLTPEYVKINAEYN